MNTDRDNFEELLLKSNKITFIKALNIINERDYIGVDNIYFELTRLLTIRDVDVDFLIKFLLHRKYLEKQKNSLIRKKKIIGEHVFEQLIDFYIINLNSYNDIFDALFTFSDFTIENDNMIINTNSVPLEYSKFIQVFHLLGIMKIYEKEGFNVILNYRIAKKLLERPLRKISQKQFEIEMEQKKERGDLAEIFVMNHEINKLKKTNYSPKRVSVDNVNLGYDIESYQIDGKNIFLEVKSLLNGKSFFWTNNEIKKAKLFGESYFIYCVLFKNNRPIKIEKIIQNPHKKIFIDNEFVKSSTGDFLINI